MGHEEVVEVSFSSKTKNELSTLPIEKQCDCIAELAGIICFAGVIGHDKEGCYLKINTENASVARRIFNLVKTAFHVHMEVKIKRHKMSKYTNSYSLYVRDEESLNLILCEVGLISGNMNYRDLVSYRINSGIIHSECCRKAFIRGAFLGSGSITDPEKTYHLEIVTHYYRLSKDLCALFEHFNLRAKSVIRKSNYVVYFKGSENIVDILNIMGAHKSLLELENIRIMKEMRNNVNRVVNCETANLEKTVDAAMKQISSIQLIEQHMGLNKLPKNLREIAELRMQYKEASLKELGERLNPPIGKSGVNHRLRKIIQIADNIQQGKNDLSEK